MTNCEKYLQYMLTKADSLPYREFLNIHELKITHRVEICKKGNSHTRNINEQ